MVESSSLLIERQISKLWQQAKRYLTKDDLITHQTQLI